MTGTRAWIACAALVLMAVPVTAQDMAGSMHDGGAPDGRRPLPLLRMVAEHQKQNMREHLEAVQNVVAGLAANDFDAIRRAALRMGYSEEMGQMCVHMGAATQGFTEQALAFHHTADRIVSAARDRDRARVIAALASTLEACTGCHAAWKQQVVDEPTWRRLQAAAHPATMMEK